MAKIAVTSGGDTYTVKEGSRVLVRTASGIEYCVVLNTTDNAVEMYKIDHGSSTLEDSIPGDVGDLLHGPSCCIDSSGLIRVVFMNNSVLPTTVPGGLVYAEFDPSTDTFNTPVQAQALSSGFLTTYPGTACAIANDRLHVAYTDAQNVKGAKTETVYYTNYDGSSWSTKVAVATNQRWPDLIIEKRNSSRRPWITASVIGTGAQRFSVFRGNVENAASFTTAQPTTTDGDLTYSIAQIVEDHQGDMFVCLPNSTSTNILVVRNNFGDSLATWTSITAVTGSAGETLKSPSIASRGQGTTVRDKYIVYGYDNGIGGDLRIRATNDFHKHQTSTWNTPTIEETNASDFPRLKWSNFHNHGGTAMVGYVYERGTGIIHDFKYLNQSAF